jgi:hypothetical protein
MMADGSAATPGPERIRLGVSSCLLGEKVRYEGGHKLDRFLGTRWAGTWSTCRCAPRWRATSRYPGRRCASWGIPRRGS